MKYLLNCIAYLILCLIVSRLISVTTSRQIRLAKATEQIKQLDEAVKLIGIGGVGEITDRKVCIENIIKARGMNNYGWRYPELEFPLKKDTSYITSEYNDIRYDIVGEYYFHDKSADMKCVDSDQIKASISGICEVGSNDIYGNYIIIKNDTWEIKYGHLERVDVIDGQEIEKSDIIGIVGNSGHCRIFCYQEGVWRDVYDYEREYGIGKHLDYSIQKNGVSKNPFTNSLYGNEL